MIWENDLQTLISQWRERENLYEPSQREVLEECIYEINNLIDRTHKEEMQIAEQEFLDSLGEEDFKDMVADEELMRMSSLENQDMWYN